MLASSALLALLVSAVLVGLLAAVLSLRGPPSPSRSPTAGRRASLGRAMAPQVLLVEDSPDDVFFVREALAEVGFETELSVARDGQEAMEFLRDEARPRPDLMLLDLNMPRKDGREVLAEVKADPELTDIPIVVLTTSSADEDIIAAYRGHANSYVRKPLAYDAFVDVVRSLERYWFSVATLPPH